MAVYLNSIETKDALINATGELVFELGINNVSTRAIAERAGENIGSIHYHFGGKAKLIKAMIYKIVADVTERYPMEEAIEKYKDVIHTREGQINTLREIVKIHMSMITGFSKRKWDGQVLYQLIHRHNPYQKVLLEEFVAPRVKLLTGLFQLICPEWTFEDAYCMHNMMLSIIIVHINDAQMLTTLINQDNFSKKYISLLEDKLLKLLMHEMNLSAGLS